MVKRGRKMTWSPADIQFSELFTVFYESREN